MLNLLFISDSPKAEYVKSVLQPVLKVIIDVVTDFDHGLKDVFEKRPTTVCIQDQIGGVTGESVARHIQMLLGNSAPRFILLHNGNSKVRAINGLYEHLVDMSQADAALATSILATLESLLGDQWDKIYIAPKKAPASIVSAAAVSAEDRVDAEKLVDDFLSDLETGSFTVLNDAPPVLPQSGTSDIVLTKPAEPLPAATPSTVEVDADQTQLLEIQSASDEMAEMLLAEVNKAALDEQRAAETVRVKPEPDVAFKLVDEPVKAPQQTVDKPVVPPPVPPVATPAPERPVVQVTPRPEPRQAVSAPPPSRKSSAATVRTLQPEKNSPIPAAEFKIPGNSLSDEPIPDELLLAFEANYRSESRTMRNRIIVGVLCVLCVGAGGWYTFVRNTEIFTALKNRIIPPSAQSAAPVPAAAPTAVAAKAAVPPAQTNSGVALPAFVPKEGLDKAFAEKNPGWERYAGATAEFRIFRNSGQIQAVQVLAKNAPIPDALVKTVVTELTGSPVYQINSQSHKAGVRIEAGHIQTKGDIKIYRKSGTIKGFVVSLN